MALAAGLAAQYHLNFPSTAAVANSRDKAKTMALWGRAGLPVPRSRTVTTADEAARFFGVVGGSCVLKPHTGTGSELVLSCDSEAQCRFGYTCIHNALDRRRNERLYRGSGTATPGILAQERVNGQEYSCDFMLENNVVTVLRLSRKLPAPNAPMGTAGGYLLPAPFPPDVDWRDFRKLLGASARVLGIRRCIAMVDFIIRRGRIVLLELSPRPGGDCLPHILMNCWKLDMLTLALDFAQRRAIHWQRPAGNTRFVGLRLFADRPGTLKVFDADALTKDPRVREVHLTRKPGHAIRMPPEDYDSWVLGHVTFAPDSTTPLDQQCATLRSQLTLKIEATHG